MIDLGVATGLNIHIVRGREALLAGLEPRRA
jgi:hypothetical protein